MSNPSEGIEGLNDQAVSWGRKRKESMAACDLNPNSLVGSWFHKFEGGMIVMQGIFIGEPQPGIYLVEIDTSSLENGPIAGGQRSVQQLVSARAMAEDEEWQFYDSDENMHVGYAQWHAREHAQ